MIVIADFGPLMALGKLGILELLAHLYGQVRLTTAVYAEVVVKGREWGYIDASVVEAAIQTGKLVVVEMSDAELPPDVASLPLDAGEKQTLYLALRDKVDLVLFDDLKAREEALSRGLTVKGTLGIIVQAFRAGLVTLKEVQAIVDIIIERDDIWIEAELCRQVLTNIKITKR